MRDKVARSATPDMHAYAHKQVTPAFVEERAAPHTCKECELRGRGRAKVVRMTAAHALVYARAEVGECATLN